MTSQCDRRLKNLYIDTTIQSKHNPRTKQSRSKPVLDINPTSLPNPQFLQACLLENAITQYYHFLRTVSDLPPVGLPRVPSPRVRRPERRCGDAFVGREGGLEVWKSGGIDLFGPGRFLVRDGLLLCRNYLEGRLLIVPRYPVCLLVESMSYSLSFVYDRLAYYSFL